MDGDFNRLPSRARKQLVSQQEQLVLDAFTPRLDQGEHRNGHAAARLSPPSPPVARWPGASMPVGTRRKILARQNKDTEEWQARRRLDTYNQRRERLTKASRDGSTPSVIFSVVDGDASANQAASSLLKHSSVTAVGHSSRAPFDSNLTPAPPSTPPPPPSAQLLNLDLASPASVKGETCREHPRFSVSGQSVLAQDLCVGAGAPEAARSAPGGRRPAAGMQHDSGDKQAAAFEDIWQSMVRSGDGQSAIRLYLSLTAEELMKIHEGEVCYIAFLREDHEAVSAARWSAEDEASPDVLGRELVMKIAELNQVSSSATEAREYCWEMGGHSVNFQVVEEQLKRMYNQLHQTIHHRFERSLSAARRLHSEYSEFAARLHEMLIKKRQSLGNLTQQNQELREKIGRLQQVTAEYEAQMATTQQQLSNVTASFESRVNTTTAKETLQSVRASEKARIAALHEADLVVIQSNITIQLEEENQSLKASMAAYSAQLDARREAEAQPRIKRLDSEAKALAKEARQLEAKLKTLQPQIDRAQEWQGMKSKLRMRWRQLDSDISEVLPVLRQAFMDSAPSPLYVTGLRTMKQRLELAVQKRVSFRSLMANVASWHTVHSDGKESHSPQAASNGVQTTSPLPLEELRRQRNEAAAAAANSDDLERYTAPNDIGVLWDGSRPDPGGEKRVAERIHKRFATAPERSRPRMAAGGGPDAKASTLAQLPARPKHSEEAASGSPQRSPRSSTSFNARSRRPVPGEQNAAALRRRGVKHVDVPRSTASMAQPCAEDREAWKAGLQAESTGDSSSHVQHHWLDPLTARGAQLGEATPAARSHSTTSSARTAAPHRPGTGRLGQDAAAWAKTRQLYA